MSNTYTNLVFEGGGVKGIAYAGALQVLGEHGILTNIKNVAGTSAGAITATLVALGYSPQEVKQKVLALNFKEFEDGWDPLRLLTQYGLYKGNDLLSWIQEMVAGKAQQGKNATFEDLHLQGLPNLYVYATDLNIFDVKQFSYIDTPKVIVAEAVRASMSIPIFFRAWKFTDSMPDDHIYVDGGVVLNYPLTVFDTLTQPDDPQTLGLYLYDYNDVKKPSALGYDHPIEYCKTLFETLLDSQNIDFSVNESIRKRTIMIDDFGILATDFDITPEQEEALFQSGVKYTTEYLNKQTNESAVLTNA